MKTIEAYFGNNATVTPAAGDTSVTIAHLAMFVEFDPADAKRFDTKPHVIAYDALKAEYGNHEMKGGDADYYTGSYMTFADGSELRIRHN